MATEPKPAPARSLDVSDLLKWVGSPIALGTALLFYFGWVRSQAQASALGVDVSVFEMSTQDMVLRSVNVLFFPIIAMLLGGLVLLQLDPWLRTHARRASLVLRYAWLLFIPLALLLLILNEEVGRTLLPLWVLLTIGGMAYGSRLRRHANGDDRPASPMQTVLVVALLVVTLFWLTERVARVGGEALAEDLKNNLADRLPHVSLVSAGDLHIEASGVTETELSGSDSEYGYRYDGLYLLQRSGDKYFLLSDGWQSNVNQGRLIVLPDDDTIRLQFGPRP